MARPRPNDSPSVGILAYPKDDPRRNKPSWFSLGGYFERKGKGDRGKRTSSLAQQKVDKGNRGSRNGKSVT